MRHLEAPSFSRVYTVLKRPRLREFLSFFGGSAAGLSVDLAGFQILTLLGFVPWQANAISSAVSITVVYVLVTRYAFGVGARASSYVLFLVWYGLSIALFSTLIQLAVAHSEWPALVWKLLSVPFSFLLNYLFSRFLFAPRLKRRSDETEGAPLVYTP